MEVLRIYGASRQYHPDYDFFILLFLLQVFVGLGQPFEGPAALEALANGCFFLNPKVLCFQFSYK